MRVITLAVATMLLTAAAPGQVAPAKLPAWMAGCWTEEKAGAWTEECWTAARGGSMLGAGRSGRGATLGHWEAMQILAEADGALAYWASPRGTGRTRFALVSSNATEIVFANPAHDYPQRIRYWREGATMIAETSLADGTKPMRWRYRRQD